MATIQTNANVSVRIARETVTGTAAVVGAAAQQVRFNASPGLELKRAVVQSAELRTDFQKSMGRLGFKSVVGSYTGEVSAGGAIDMLLEAVMRGVWSVAAALTTATGAGACVDLTPNSTSTLM